MTVMTDTGPASSSASATAPQPPCAKAYKYDSQGRLVLSRPLNSTGTDTPYGYDSAGLLPQDNITANLGAVVNWTTSPSASQWAGSLEAGACFAAGTLVHTRDGLKPIEQIQVGDMVLSKHESGEGERAYKRVTKTFVHEDSQLTFLPYMGCDDDDRPVWFDGLLVTPNHPIWLVGKGWKEVEKIKFNTTKFELVEPANIKGGRCKILYSTLDPDIVWMSSSYSNESLGWPGTLYDVSQYTYVLDEITPQCSKSAWWGDDRGIKGKKPGKEHLLRARVYNLEVEDLHTYYVGKYGIWVHNKNLKIDTRKWRN